MMLVLPIVQLIVLVNAATQDMKSNRLIIVDQDGSTLSQQIISKFKASDFFQIQYITPNKTDAFDIFNNGNTDAIILIPHNTEKDILKQKLTSIQIITNAINSQQAQITFNYAKSIISDYSINIRARYKIASPNNLINVSQQYWFNPELNYKFYMLPGILVILVTIIGMFMAAMNLVREKEMGTLEQINVTPVKKYQFIIAKLVPFWVIALFELGFGLLIGKLLYNIPIEGNLFVLFSFAGIYLVAVLGIGLYISTNTQTQQQVMFISYFFLMIFVMMSGLFTAVENMPEWGQIFDHANPLYYFIQVIRTVLLKGSGFADIRPMIIGVSIIAAIILPLAVHNYRKTT
jgi:ABC-2 type transport system permease protein